jgi:putative GTP pyrophosphokinase
MVKAISKSQIDRLGERLRKGKADDDLRLLEQYRRSFSTSYETVVDAIREKLLLEPTGRPTKSTPSIVDKLCRESIRLTQIQDIAGCRLIAKDIANQDQIASSLCKLFENTTIIDRRGTPSHGYRAVHIIVRIHGKLIEVQVRTELQHLWAELSEKLADIFGQKVKYGDGNDDIKRLLNTGSENVRRIETSEVVLRNFRESQPESEHLQLIEVETILLSNRQEMLDILREVIKDLEKLERLV